MNLLPVNRVTPVLQLSSIRSSLARLGTLALLGLLPASSASGRVIRDDVLQSVVIDFEDLNAPGNGTGGLTVANQYADRGITFAFPTALDYSQGTPILPGFAHSGTKAVELCYGAEFCVAPLRMNFTAAQPRVKVWVGYSYSLASAELVVMRAYDQFGFQLAQATATLGPSTGVIPIATPLEVTRPTASIRRVTIGFLGAESGQIFNNSLAVDDVEFDIQGPPPPCPASSPPSIVVNSPIEGQIVVANVFTFNATVTSPDPFATLRLDVTGSGGTRTFGPVFISSAVRTAPFDVTLSGLTDFLFAGQNTLSITLQDCRGSAQATRTIYYRNDVTSTVVHVMDDCRSDLAGAQVYVNGVARGFTDAAGRLEIRPPLPDGAELVATRFLHESSTYRGNHGAGSYQNWKYRVYTTSLIVPNNGVTVPQPVVLEPDPLAPQELCILRTNTLIGIHVVASLEWDATQEELQDVRDHFINASPFLYNATDGQMFFEQVEVVDNATFWEDADYRIYANLGLRSNVDCPLGGFFDDSFWCDGSWIHIPRAPCPGCYSWFSKFPTYVHEFGHYGFGLGDEYSDDNANTRCTAALATADPSNPFSSGMPAASCLMYLETVAPKFCSDLGQNRHVHGTDQGDNSCWHDLVSRFRDGQSTPRWILATPVDRGGAVGQINGGRVPVSAWVPRIAIDNRARADLCGARNLASLSGGLPGGVPVWLVTTYSQFILEGQTDSNGDLAVTGLHVGDILVVNPSYFFGVPVSGILIPVSSCTPAPLTAPQARAENGGKRDGAGVEVLEVKAWPSPLGRGAELHIEFTPPRGAAGDLDVGVFDVSGRRAASLTEVVATQDNGVVSLSWSGVGRDGVRLAPGVYIIRAASASVGYRSERKIVIGP